MHKGIITNLFLELIVWAVITIPFVSIQTTILVNSVIPVITNQPYGSIGILLFWITISILWFLIPIGMIANELRGSGQ